MHKYRWIAIVFLFLASTSWGQLEIYQLTDSIFVCTTYQPLENGHKYPSNNVYYLTPEGIVMIDTPWDKSQMPTLLDSMQRRHGMQPVFSISTHFHADRTAGLDYLDSIGVKTYSTAYTRELCIEHNEEIPQYTFQGDTTFHVGGKTIETFYPGHGHAPDNIVVYLKDEEILVGGCIVRSTATKVLGYTGNANIPSWDKAMKKIRKRYKKAKVVIPGHLTWKGDHLKHTSELLKKSIKKSKK